MLRDAYRDYLAAGATPAAADKLAVALDDRRFPEAALIAAYARNGAGWQQHDDAHVYVSPWPPKAVAGQRWFDTSDLSSNVLLRQFVPEDDRECMSEEALARLENRWFALRPVARFQYAAFLAVAEIERSTPQALDPARWAGGEDLAPVTGLLCNEASLYLSWVGKSFAGDGEWFAARELFGTAPWAPGLREWIGGSPRTSGLVAVVGPDILTRDFNEDQLYDELLESDRPADVTFRPAVLESWGLRMTVGRQDIGIAGARVLSRCPRPPQTTT